MQHKKEGTNNGENENQDSDVRVNTFLYLFFCSVSIALFINKAYSNSTLNIFFVTFSIAIH